MITSSVRMDRAEWKRARECRPRYALLPLAALGKTIDETKLPTATAAVHSDSTAIRIRARIKTLEALQCGPLKRAPAPLRAGALGRRGDDRANRAFTPRIGSQRLARLEFCALRTVYFNTGTRGFAAPEDSTTAVCILPGTELAFSEEVKCNPTPFGFSSWRTKTVNYRTAIFRQVNKDQPRVHHDALEFPDGTSVLLTDVLEGQEATVLQLPTQPKTPAEEVAERRVIYIG